MYFSTTRMRTNGKRNSVILPGRFDQQKSGIGKRWAVYILPGFVSKWYG
jgi:hypothetical protein